MKDITNQYDHQLGQKILEIVKQFPSKKILEAGDIMLDWTIYGKANGVSPEAVAIKVLTRSDESTFTSGGAANCAKNCSSLGAKTSVWGVIDAEDPSNFDRRIPFGFILKKTLEDEMIEWIGETDSDRETTVKLRIQAANAHTAYQLLTRIDMETHDPYHIKDPARLQNGYDVYHVGDYNKGAVTPELIQILREESQKHQVPLVVDPKMGKARDYHALYSNVTAITPNDLELSEITGQKFHEEDSETIAKIASDYVKELETDIVVTRGRFGCVICTKEGTIAHLKTLKVDVPDVAGLGDTFGAAYALSLGSGADQIEAAHIAMMACYIAAQKKGIASVMREELLAEINRRIAEAVYPFD